MRVDRLHLRETRLMLEMAPEEGGEEIGQNDIRHHGADRGRRQTPVDLFRYHLLDKGSTSEKAQLVGGAPEPTHDRRAMTC